MPPRLPRQQFGVYGDSESDFNRAKGALAGFTGAGERPSVMEPGAAEAYDNAELLSLLTGAAGMVGPAAKGAKAVLGPLRTIGGRSGAIPINEFERYRNLFKPAEGERILYHSTDMPWEGNTPRPGTWFSTEPPAKGNPFGSTVRAYSVPEELLRGSPIPRGRGFAGSVEGAGPVAVIDDSGVTSYVVNDPSVLRRKEVKRPINMHLASGTPLSQRGAVGELDDTTIYDYLPRQVQSMVDPDVGLSIEDIRKLFPKDWNKAEHMAMSEMNMRGLRDRYFDMGSEYVDKLPHADREAVVNYVAGSGPLHAYSINERLRRGVIPEQAELIDQVMKNAPRAEAPFTMYRGQPLQAYYDPAYMSISKERGVADAYADSINAVNDLEPHDIKMGHPKAAGTIKLILPERTPLVSPDIEQFFSDEEMLLPRGTRQEGNEYTRRLILPEGYKRGGLVSPLQQYCNCKGK